MNFSSVSVLSMKVLNMFSVVNVEEQRVQLAQAQGSHVLRPGAWQELLARD